MRNVFAAAAALAVLAPFGSAWGDPLVQSLDMMAAQRHGMMGDIYLARLSKIEDIAMGNQTRRVLTVEVITRPGILPEDFAPVAYTIQFGHQDADLPPENKPVLMMLRVFNNQGALMPFGSQQNRRYYYDRGVPGDRLYDLTCRLLFPQQDAIDQDVFYQELLELARDADSSVAGMAAHYIGSRLNVYAHRRCPENVIVAFSDYILDPANASQRAVMASFFRHARLPLDASRVIALLSFDDTGITSHVRARLNQESHRAGPLASAFSGVLLSPDKPSLRESILQIALAWNRHAEPLWDVAETLVIDPDAHDVSQEHQALAAQILVNVDPNKAENTVRNALPRLDSPVIYRFLYERRMYDTTGVLVDKLRHDQGTRHAVVIRALLAALTRDLSIDDNAGWVAWWDDMENQGSATDMVRRQFVPPGAIENEIDALIQYLGATDFRKRREAIARLHRIGPAANPKLETARRHDDFEIRVAAGQLLAENEKRLQPVIDQLYGRQRRQTPRGPGRR